MIRIPESSTTAKDSVAELLTPFWLDVMHCRARDIGDTGDGLAFRTGRYFPLTLIRTDTTCADCGGTRWIFRVNERKPDEERVLMTGHGDDCPWFTELLDQGVADGTITAEQAARA